MMLQRYNKKARLQNSLAFFCCFLFNIGLHGFNGFFLSPDEPDEPDYFSFANGEHEGHEDKNTHEIG